MSTTPALPPTHTQHDSPHTSLRLPPRSPCLPAGIQIITYLLWGNNMIAQSFLLSCFFTSSRTATVFAYLVVFGTGIVGQLLLGQLVESGRWYVILLQLHPSFALYRCVCWRGGGSGEEKGAEG